MIKIRRLYTPAGTGQRISPAVCRERGTDGGRGTGLARVGVCRSNFVVVTRNREKNRDGTVIYMIYHLST